MLKKIFFVLVAALALASCQTQMSHLTDFEQAVDLEASYTIPDMEFIGFKGSGNFGQVTHDEMRSIMNSKVFKRVGSQLQNAGIASDMSETYFGIYSLQEIETYKNKKRYVTFVDMSDFELTYADATNYTGQVLGEVCIGTIFLAPVGAIVCLACPYQTKMHLKGTCKIVVYDAVTKTVRGTENIDIDKTDIYKGLWPSTKDDVKQEIIDNYSTMLSNAILEKYPRVKRALGI